MVYHRFALLVGVLIFGVSQGAGSCADSDAYTRNSQRISSGQDVDDLLSLLQTGNMHPPRLEAGSAAAAAPSIVYTKANSSAAPVKPLLERDLKSCAWF